MGKGQRRLRERMGATAKKELVGVSMNSRPMVAVAVVVDVDDGSGSSSG